MIQEGGQGCRERVRGDTGRVSGVIQEVCQGWYRKGVRGGTRRGSGCRKGVRDGTGRG